MTTNNELAAIKPAATLAPLSIKETVLAQFKEAETGLTAMAERYRDVAYDVKTPRGMKEAKEARADLRDNGRLLVTRAATRIKADVNALKKVMDDEVDRLVAIVKPIEEAIGAQIRVEEDRKAAEKAERERIEAERIAKHRANIDKLKSYVARAEGQPIEAIEQAIVALDRLEFGDAWEEFLTEAIAARDSTIESMRKMVENERQRQENERLARELAEARAKLAAHESAPPPAAPAPTAPTQNEPEKVDGAITSHAQKATEFVAKKPEVSTTAPAPLQPKTLGMTELSEDEFKLLISNGGTLTIGKINSRLELLKIDAAALAALGIATRKDSGACHMEAADFTALCDKLITHLQRVRDSAS